MQDINYILRMYMYVVKYKQMHGNDKYELLESGCLWWGNKGDELVMFYFLSPVAGNWSFILFCTCSWGGEG